jgi:hypothetical protein
VINAPGLEGKKVIIAEDDPCSLEMIKTCSKMLRGPVKHFALVNVIPTISTRDSKGS